MTDDDKALVESLRDMPVWPMEEAADRIEALSAENERLREALQWYIDNDETNEGDEPLDERGGRSWNEINAFWIDGRNRALAALGETK